MLNGVAFPEGSETVFAGGGEIRDVYLDLLVASESSRSSSTGVQQIERVLRQASWDTAHALVGQRADVPIRDG